MCRDTARDSARAKLEMFSHYRAAGVSVRFSYQCRAVAVDGVLRCPVGESQAELAWFIHAGNLMPVQVSRS